MILSISVLQAQSNDISDMDFTAVDIDLPGNIIIKQSTGTQMWSVKASNNNYTQYVHAEVHSSRGRADCVLETDRFVYIFEFKLNKSAKKAIRQIVDKHYYEKFQSCGLPIKMIGVNFNSAKGRIDGWKEMALP